jgi:hypothetical protein
LIVAYPVALGERTSNDQNIGTIAGGQPAGYSRPVRQERHELVGRFIGWKYPGIVTPAENGIWFSPADISCPPDTEHGNSGQPGNSFTESESQRNHAENGRRHQCRTRSEGSTAFQDESYRRETIGKAEGPNTLPASGSSTIRRRTKISY